MQESIEMGGALKYFHILNLLFYFLFPFVFSALIIAFFFFPEKLQFTLSTLPEFILGIVKFVGSLYVVKNVKNKNRKTPQKIMIILSVEFFSTLSIWLLISFFIVIDYETILWASLYYFVWVAFFMLSKEVKSFYQLSEHDRLAR